MKLKDVYLDLLKKSLSDTLRDSNNEKEYGLIWPKEAETMIGNYRLNNIRFCIETVIKENIEGDFIETGVWRGGGCIFARGVLLANDITDLKIYVADSFEGLPPPDITKWPADVGDMHHTHSDVLAISETTVMDNFKRYNLFDEQVVFLKGWFENTLPTAPIKKLAVLRLDGDMYGSTMVALTNLYPKLSKGGFCIIDDYTLHGARRAMEDFRCKEQIGSTIIPIDTMSIYWRNE